MTGVQTCALPIYNLNIYSGKFIGGETGNLNREYYGSDYRGLIEDVFIIPEHPIPVWKLTYLIPPSGHRTFEGNIETWIDKATGIVIYQINTWALKDNPTAKVIEETISLSTNAPIGDISDGKDFSYSKKQVNCRLKTAQHSVHPTCGILRHFRAFSSLRVFPAPRHCPRPPTRR